MYTMTVSIGAKAKYIQLIKALKGKKAPPDDATADSEGSGVGSSVGAKVLVVGEGVEEGAVDVTFDVRAGSVSLIGSAGD